jgi:hypothetical protein
LGHSGKKAEKMLRGEGLSSITSHLIRAVSSVVEHYLDTVIRVFFCFFLILSQAFKAASTKGQSVFDPFLRFQKMACF